MVNTTSLDSKHKWFRALAILFIITQVLPPINALVPIPNDYNHALFLVMATILFPNILMKKSIVSLFIYLFFAFLYFLLGNAFFGGIGSVTGPLCYMTAGLFLTEYAIQYDDDYKFTRNVIIIMIVSNVFMAIISIPEILVMPNILRYTFSSDTRGDFTAISRFLISYNTCHGLVLLFPAMIFICRKYFKKNKKLFWFWLISTLILFVIVYLSNATTALIVSIFIIILSFILRGEVVNSRSVAMVFVAGVIALILSSKSVMIPILDFIQSKMDETWSNYYKIDDIKQGMMYGESSGDVENRRVLYEQSIDLFIESPIIGTRHPEMIGHHSWFVDRLACLGIFLIIPLVLVFRYHIRAVYKDLIHGKIVYILGTVALIILLFAKNDFGVGSWLYGFAFLPLFCRYVDYVVDKIK